MRLSSRFILPAIFVFYALNYMDRSALGILGEAIQLDMGFSDQQMGMLHSLLLFGLLLTIVPCAALNDVFGRRRMLSMAAGLWSAAMVFTGMAAGFLSLGVARFLGSANDAFTGAGGSSWIAWAYPPEKRGKAIGLFLMSGPFGMALGTVFAGLVLYLTDNWRLSFFLLAVPGLALIWLFRTLPDYQPAPFKGYFAGVPGILRTRTIVMSGVVAGLYSGLVYAHQAWGGPLLMRNYDLSSGKAGLLFAVMLASGIIGPFLGGVLSDVWNRRSPNGRLKAGVLAVLCLGLSKLFFYGCVGKVSLPMLVLVGIFDGIFTMMPTPVFFTMVQDVTPERYRGIGTGMMGAISFLAGGAFIPYLTGLVSDSLGGGAIGLRLSLMGMTGFALVAACIGYTTLRKKYAQEKLS